MALDPGVRTFLTYFSETECGKLGHHAFGRIQRLCHWLDELISRTAKEPNRRKRRQMRRAQARMRQRITNLVDELHWQLARWLTSNYRIILLPTFETQDMTQSSTLRILSGVSERGCNSMVQVAGSSWTSALAADSENPPTPAMSGGVPNVMASVASSKFCVKSSKGLAGESAARLLA